MLPHEGAKTDYKARERHKHFRCDRYSPMLHRQKILRNYEATSDLARAQALLKADRVIGDTGKRVNWPGKDKLYELYQDQSQLLAPSMSSTSISFTSNVDKDSDSPTPSFGGSLPSTPKAHLPLQKTNDVSALDMGRISISNISPIRGPTNAADTSTPFQKPTVLFTSTPIANALPPRANCVPFPAPNLQPVPLFKPCIPTASNSNSTDSGKFSIGADKSSDSEPQKNNTVNLNTPVAPMPLPAAPATIAKGSEAWTHDNGLSTAAFVATATTVSRTTVPLPGFGNQTTSPATAPPQPTATFSASTGAPLFASITHTPVLVPIATTTPPSNPLPAQVVSVPAAASSPPSSPPATNLPQAFRWLRYQRDQYRKMEEKLTQFNADAKNKSIRSHLKSEIGNLFDLSFKSPTDQNLHNGLLALKTYLDKLMSGKTMQSVLSPNETYKYNHNDPLVEIFLCDLLARRIIRTVADNKDWMLVMISVYNEISKCIEAFSSFFRTIIVNSTFLLQLNLPDLAAKLKERLQYDPERFAAHGFARELVILQLFIVIESNNDYTKSTSFSTLCGIRLLHSLYSVCCDEPQVPITTITVLFEIVQKAGARFTDKTCPYIQHFAKTVLPRLMTLQGERVTEGMAALRTALGSADNGVMVEKIHTIAVQRVVDKMQRGKRTH